MVFKRVNHTINPQIFRKFPQKFESNVNYTPLNKSIEHKSKVLTLYKDLLKLSNKLVYAPYKEFCLQHIHNRFRFYKSEKDYKRVWGLLEEAKQSKQIIEKCLTNDYNSLKLLDDMVWGRQGFLKDKLKFIESHPNFNKEAHRMTTDLRSLRNKVKTGGRKATPLTFNPEQFAIQTNFPKKERLLQEPSNKVKVVRTNYGITFLKFIGRPIPHWFSYYINKKIYREVDRRKNLKVLEEYKSLMENELEFEKSLGLKGDEDYCK